MDFDVKDDYGTIQISLWDAAAYFCRVQVADNIWILDGKYSLQSKSSTKHHIYINHPNQIVVSSKFRFTFDYDHN